MLSIGILHSQRNKVLIFEQVTASHKSQILSHDTSVFYFTATHWRHSNQKTPYERKPVPRKPSIKTGVVFNEINSMLLRLPYYENMTPFGYQNYLFFHKLLLLYHSGSSPSLYTKTTSNQHTPGSRCNNRHQEVTTAEDSDNPSVWLSRVLENENNTVTLLMAFMSFIQSVQS